MSETILIGVLLSVQAANCQGATAFSPSQRGIGTISLWPPDKIPTGAQPMLTIFRPQPGKSSGTAVIIAPGGAYIGLALNLEGSQVADWYTARGVRRSFCNTACVGNIRIPYSTVNVRFASCADE